MHILAHVNFTLMHVGNAQKHPLPLALAHPLHSKRWKGGHATTKHHRKDLIQMAREVQLVTGENDIIHL